MRLTSRGRYAVTAMIDLAMQKGSSPVCIAEIAERNNLPTTYLEQLFAKLRRAGLVHGTRGPGGGYTLAKEPWDITVADVLAAVDEGVDSTRCGGKRDCNQGSECITHDLWAAMNDHILEFLASVSLQSLAQKAASRPRA